MEEHVALDSKKQKKFVKSLKGIKKLMKETGALPEKTQKEKEHVKTGKIKKNKRRSRRGLVYLSHIPHGFYEHQMTEYFKQFGVVTNARVIRSKHTGRSKGYGFIEFRDLPVAQVVAETMNNYLMGKRLIKAVYIPPKDQRVNARRKNWNLQNNPGRKLKLKMKKSYNANKSEDEDMKIACKLFTNLTNTKNKLKDLGIDYDFFTPVDVPEGLMEQLEVKKEADDKKDIVDEKPNKKKKQNKGLKDETDKKTNDIADAKKEKPTMKEKKQKKGNKDIESNEKNTIAVVNNKNKKQSTEKIKENAKKNKKDNIETTVHEAIKKQKLKAAGVKPLEDYVSIVNEEDNESDSSYQFDSDDFDNELNADDSDVSSDDVEDNENDESNEDNNNEESDEDVDSDSKEIPLQRNNKKTKKIEVPKEASKPKAKQVPFMQLMKRKAEKTAVPSKKPKFEKQNNKKLPSKQLKKKK
ncbi:PREDICTED: MKI67 FHA domain-interacting nucleolar phosphoprotein [Papilio xuthus]|uniref:MKI67 FHA domain-interacting nucleolar phosphoprotein n=1 Tax=Papilio xuthus TaxID=66420 RepID=A0AAJ6ZGB4_PAPXU|nr:PREDICTED: MKI67 FHA domain-interacting nucleolar phosphoprotein [Papilio xuthus]